MRKQEHIMKFLHLTIFPQDRTCRNIFGNNKATAGFLKQRKIKSGPEWNASEDYLLLSIVDILPLEKNQPIYTRWPHPQTGH